MTTRDDAPSERQPSATTLVDGAATSAAVGDGPLPAGTTFAGRYHVRRRVGVGGMGFVYQAFDTVLSEDVAIKVIRPEILADPTLAADIERRFKRELLLGRKVSHPSVVRVHDVGEAQGLRYLTMSYVDGRDLATVLETDGAMSPERVVRIGRRLGVALVAVHAAGVIHRDLKPANVLLGRSDQVWLTDFGIARLVEDDADPAAASLAGSARLGRVTRVGKTVGTPDYMAPEQSTGATADERSDQYAFGLILYDLLIGGHAATTGGGATGAPAGTRRRVRLIRPEVPDELDEVLARALDPDPAKRFPTTASMVDALARIEDGSRDAASTAAIGARASPSVVRVAGADGGAPTGGRGRRGVWIAAAVVAAVAVGTAIFVVQRGASTTTATDASRTSGSPAAAAATGAAPMRSVAVLPFVDLSEKKDQAYFAEGLAEELLNELAQVPDLRVPGRRSSFYFKGKDTPTAEIGRQLTVAHVLEGSVRKSGDRLRVSAALVRTSDGVQVWTKTFEETATDVFAVQDEIARAVVAALAVTLPRAATQYRTANAAAYDLLLQGRSLLRQNTPDATRNAFAMFRRAIALDPEYGPAHAQLSIALYEIANYTADADAVKTAREAADRAIQFAPELPDGYLSRSTIATNEHEWNQARADLDRAMALDAGNPDVQHRSAVLLWAVGRAPEAMAAVRRALAVDPLRPDSWRNLAYLQAATGDLAGARVALRRSLDLSPRAVLGLVNLGELELAEGNARAALEAYRRVEDEAFRLHGIALAEHALGNASRSDAALRELIAKNAGDSAYQIAEVHAWRGDKDRAFEWLERARIQRDGGLQTLLLDPLLRPLHTDARWKPFVAKMGLPTDAP